MTRPFARAPRSRGLLMAWPLRGIVPSLGPPGRGGPASLALAAVVLLALGLVGCPDEAPPSFALGSLEVSPLELAAAYVAMRDGQVVEPRPFVRLERPGGRRLRVRRPSVQRAVSPATAWLVRDLMRSAVREGTARRAAIDGEDVAAKTGTSSDRRDAWMAGEVAGLSIVVWVGLDDGSPLGLTGSAMKTGLVFLAATLPNLLLGPIAGTLVDRWDQKRVMIVSDLVRAGLVLTLPFAAEINVWLVYPLVFIVTTVSLFFRPAKTAILPRIVKRADLTPANGAIWTGETLADIAGYPLAGVFVAFLGTNLALAFWVDSLTYVISAVLLVGLVIPPAVREAGPRVTGAIASFIEEMREGWHFLRRDAALFQNTLVSIVAQLSIGATLALMIVYAQRSLDGDIIGFPENYAIIEASIGLGNLIGGFIIGASYNSYRNSLGPAGDHSVANASADTRALWEAANAGDVAAVVDLTTDTCADPWVKFPQGNGRHNAKGQAETRELDLPDDQEPPFREIAGILGDYMDDWHHRCPQTGD